MNDDDIGLSLEEEAPKEETEQTEEVGLSLGDEEAPKEVSRPDDVPEAYEFEGESDQFNELVGGVAKEIGLSQEKAQRLASAIDRANDEAVYTQSLAWLDELKKDPEVGGANLEANLKLARSVFDRFADDYELKILLATSGVTNHPKFIKMFAAIGKVLPPQESPASNPFPNTKWE